MEHQSEPFKQRADYTFKYNRHVGRHGWLRLTPAYSVKLVEELLLDAPPTTCVLDPFAGTATTLLCAGYHHLKAVGYELNPFLVWLGNTKTRQYTPATLSSLTQTVARIASDIRRQTPDAPSHPPPIHNISRWWHTPELQFLCALQTQIEQAYPAMSPEKNILLVIFCRMVISLSNAAFNHQSLSFKNTERPQTLALFPDSADFSNLLLKESEQVCASLLENPQGEMTIIHGDSRNLDHIPDHSIDLLITSPPYPNRISYIRELRPYMYWLGYLKNGRDAGELDWDAIGGTWGIATSRLTTWEKSPQGFYPDYLKNVLTTITQPPNPNGQVLSQYIAKYFEDIWQHLHQVSRVMRPGGQVHYIIGNSVFYGNMLPVEVIYKDMLHVLGFKNITIKTLRKRNSKKALYEFDVSAEK